MNGDMTVEPREILKALRGVFVRKWMRSARATKGYQVKRLTVDGLVLVVVVAVVAVRCPVGLMIYYGLPDMFVELAYLLLFTLRIYKRVYI